MQILLQSDPNTDGSQLMAVHFATVVKAAMGRFGERVTRVEAHLSDAVGQARTSGNDIHCTLQATLQGLDAIVVKEQSGNAHQAIDGALRKLKRAVGAEIAKHDPRGQRSQAAVPAVEGGQDDAAGPEPLTPPA
jgi:ribosome-associated translation inhibitor RaiA